MSRIQSALTVLTYALAACLSAAATTMTLASVDSQPEEEPTLEQREEEALQVLRNGSPEGRLEVAERIAGVLRLGIFSEAEDSGSPEDLVDGLILYLHQETDDWIARSLLDSLLWDDAPTVNRLFREALRSESINIQVMAIRRFSDREDPEACEALESLWKHKLPPWVRAELMGALAEQGSTVHLNGIMSLTRDDDPELREAAIKALDTLAQPESIPALRRVARTGTREDRAAALLALGAFPDSDEALQETLRATWSDEAPILRAAIGALGRLRSPDGDDRLLALLDDPSDADLRAAIAMALEGSTHADATAALVRLLHQDDAGAESWIGATALRVLHNRDDPAAIPGLRDLASQGGRDRVGILIAYLSRDRSVDKKGFAITSGCSLGSTVLPDNPRAWHVAPPAPRVTIRCWDGPQRPGDPEEQLRIPAGTLVLIQDHFDDRGAPWVQVEGPSIDSCWVPLDQLRQGPGPGAPSLRHGPCILHEFDIGQDELDSPRARRLSEAGLLSVFEPGDEVAGVALEVEMSDEEMGFVRAQLSEEEDTVLDSALQWVLDSAESED